jgi:hypothetical protein
MTERDHLEKLYRVIAEERRILLGGKSQMPTASAAAASDRNASAADAEVLRVEASYVRVLDAIRLCVASIDAERGKRE